MIIAVISCHAPVIIAVIFCQAPVIIAVILCQTPVVYNCHSLPGACDLQLSFIVATLCRAPLIYSCRSLACALRYVTVGFCDMQM